MSNATPVFLAAVAAWGISSTYTAFRPVVVQMQAEPVAFDDGAFTARVIGKKIKDCQPVAGTFAGWYRNDAAYFGGGAWIETAFSFPDDATPNSARPEGFQDFGLWRWEGLPNDATQVQMSLTHNCGGKLVVTEIGPFDIEPTAEAKND